MKLSEAIRFGGMMKPQGKGVDSIVSRDAPCALGGALQSINRQPEDQTLAFGILLDQWPWIRHFSMCPCGRPHYHCVRPEMTIVSIIGALNDLHGWSRSQIADWVETFEPPKAEDLGHEAPVVSSIRR